MSGVCAVPCAPCGWRRRRSASCRRHVNGGVDDVTSSYSDPNHAATAGHARLSASYSDAGQRRPLAAVAEDELGDGAKVIRCGDAGFSQTSACDQSFDMVVDKIPTLVFNSDNPFRTDSKTHQYPTSPSAMETNSIKESFKNRVTIVTPKDFMPARPTGREARRHSYLDASSTLCHQTMDDATACGLDASFPGHAAYARDDACLRGADACDTENAYTGGDAAAAAEAAHRRSASVRQVHTSRD